MAEQYYTRDPQGASRPQECRVSWRGQTLTFLTDAGVFSRGELDTGTRLLLDALPDDLAGSLLDVGCGWGAIGICLAKAYPGLRVTMADVNLRALALAEENARRCGAQVRCLESDGLAALAGERFDWIVTNPPIRAGKQVIYRIFAEAAAALRPGGALFLVIRKQQGGDSAIRFLKEHFAAVEKLDRSGGFWVIRADAPSAPSGASCG